MRFCTTHRACESARSIAGLADPFCEVSLHQVMEHDLLDPCTLVDALIVTKEDGEWPDGLLDHLMESLFDQDWTPHYPNPLLHAEKILDALERAEP